MKKYKHTFTIYRSLWLRGEKDSALLRSTDNKQCCLGFYLESCGSPKEALLDKLSPHNLADTQLGEHNCTSVPKWLIKSIRSEKNIEGAVMFSPSKDAEQLMLTNDSCYRHEEAREIEIKDIFARQGIEVIFKD